MKKKAYIAFSYEELLKELNILNLNIDFKNLLYILIPNFRNVIKNFNKYFTKKIIIIKGANYTSLDGVKVYQNKVLQVCTVYKIK